MKPITTPAAYALAEEVIKLIGNKSEQIHKKNLARASKSQEFKVLKALANEREKLNERMEKLTELISKRYPGVEVSTYGSVPRIKTRTVFLKDKREIKNKLIVASHIKGLPPQKLVEHVVNEMVVQGK